MNTQLLGFVDAMKYMPTGTSRAIQLSRNASRSRLRQVQAASAIIAAASSTFTKRMMTTD